MTFTFAFTLLIFFICRLESAVLDLVADDSEGLQKQKSRYHWDKVDRTI